ncbi:hypothetical protein EVAR_102582_1 [Eumeta japonica]|uniref:Uncharacterized protein n=1 Tax=Eumeta variegata TaxID=151549 RepID=A0A4C1TV13_EUMVA|nr:hypothetical protein EVAR_102582_1 [Eumeta japonica]
MAEDNISAVRLMRETYKRVTHQPIQTALASTLTQGWRETRPVETVFSSKTSNRSTNNIRYLVVKFGKQTINTQSDQRSRRVRRAFNSIIGCPVRNRSVAIRGHCCGICRSTWRCPELMKPPAHAHACGRIHLISMTSRT